MAESKDEVKKDACLCRPKGVQSFAVLNCTIESKGNNPELIDIVDISDNVSVTNLTSDADLGVDLTFSSRPNTNKSQDVTGLVDCAITSGCNTTQISCTITSGCSTIQSNSNVNLKRNVSKTLELPTTSHIPHPSLSLDCAPCKIPKLSMREIDADLSNSTITSGSLMNTNTSADIPNNLQMQNVEAKRFDDSSSSALGSKVKNPQVFYNVLDMFPHVDTNFVFWLCNQKTDLNDIVNSLLEIDERYKIFPEDKTLNIIPNMNKSVSNSDKPITHNNNTLNNVNQVQDSEKVKQTVDKELIQLQDCQEVKQAVEKELIQLQDYHVVKQTVEKEPAISKKLEFLIQVLPDADRSFLESKSKLEENLLRDFVSEALETKEYPRSKVKLVENVPEPSSSDEELGLYTKSFNIEHFLKIFPEPVKYFMDENRKCQQSEHAVQFLKRMFRFHSLTKLRMMYKKFNYNLSRTFEALESEPNSRTTKRATSEINMPQEQNLVFLKEACFVEHKTEILSYLKSKAEAQQLEYDLAKANGELIECGCCYDQTLFENCAACDDGDLFCKSCIKKSAEVRIGDGLNTFPCLLACGGEFSLNLLQNLLDANIFSRLIKRIQLEEVKAADIEGLEVCPFCEFATIPPPDTNIFTCLNPECLKESCRKCHKVSHIPQRCEEIENDDQARARKYIEDEMTKALVRECYKCKKSFIKTDGCNKMTCTCGAKMCYICRQPITDYKHFNGPGGADTAKCPLYSTDKVLHVDAVNAVAKQALENLSSTNPSLQLKHDPTKVEPTVAKSTLPPGVQEDAAALIQRLNQLNRPQQQQQHNVQPPQQPRHANLENIIDNVARNGHQFIQPAPPPPARPLLNVQHHNVTYRQPVALPYPQPQNRHIAPVNNRNNIPHDRIARQEQMLNEIENLLGLMEDLQRRRNATRQHRD